MPRKAHIVKREIVPDPLHQSTLISKFANCMMYGGKKSTAQGIIYGALSIIEKKTSDDPVKLFKKAIENVKPVLEVKSRRVGGSTYQVPVEVGPARRTSLSIRWILTYSRARGLFAGVSLQGATLRPDHDANKDMYGKRMSNQDVVLGSVKPPATAGRLIAELNRHSNRRARG